ncbi:MAG: hypothetical protein QM773_20345 [Hyphomonadaceae bacterium]
MSLGDIFSSLVGRLARETVQDAALRGLADHANRRKRGEPEPASVRCSALVLVLCTITTAALLLVLAWLIFNPMALGEDDRIAGFFISAGLAIVALFGLWQAIARRIDWDKISVRFRAWNGQRTMPWSDIVGIEDKSYPPRIRITFRDGKGFTIYETMRGSRYFRYLVEQHVTPQPDGNKRRRRRQRGKKR